MTYHPRSGFGPEITEAELRDVGTKALNACLIEWAYKMHDRGVPTSQIRQWLIPTTVTRDEREVIMRTLITRDLGTDDPKQQLAILIARGLPDDDASWWTRRHSTWMQRGMLLGNVA